ncbi:MAG: type II toxin-antitoxin system VapC family toxin [Alphaproteobacteria bacterium]
MILADTSVWIDHFRRHDAALAERLNRQAILCHPFVIGEIALGSLRNRAAILRELARLPRARVAGESEILAFVEAQRLHGSGIGYVDAHLLAAVRLTPGASLWTRDRRLREVAERLGLSAPP